jgi:FkbM family methyltransferase
MEKQAYLRFKKGINSLPVVIQKVVWFFLFWYDKWFRNLSDEFSLSGYINIKTYEMYSQKDEEKIIVDYFGSYIGNLLDVGANDGVTYSNSKKLIEKGWSGLLVEPSKKAFQKLAKTHQGNSKVVLANVAVGTSNGECTLYDSGDFSIKDVTSIRSTVRPEEMQQWFGPMTFDETKCMMVTFAKLMEGSKYKKFDFITIDCEGYDLDVLRQIDLDGIGCRCLCIEHNRVQDILAQIKDYVLPHGFKQIGFNSENIIFAKP